VTLVDVDGDGLPDLVTVSPQTYAVTVAYQQANGTLGPAAPLFGATPLAVGPVQFVNITGSGAPDVLFAGNNPADQNASIIIVPHRR
jgi:hypothetical protein